MIPKNWRWITLNDFAECLDNLRVPVNAKERSKRIGNIPYYGATGQTGWIDNYLTNEQLVLLGEDGAPFLDIFKDKAYIIDGKAWINNHVHILKSYFGDIGNRYLKYYLNNFDFKDYVSGTTRLKLTQSKMKSIPIPLPPLDEQQRIVDIIENLFSKLDRSKALAQNVIDNYELRRSAILNTVFNGSDNLEIKSLDECGTWSGGGTPSMKHKEYWENANILWVTPKDMKSDTINNTQMKINSIGVENSSAKLIKNPSVLFVMRSGILRHTLPISMIELEFTCNQDLKVLTPFDKINVKYLMLACKANEKSILNNCMKNGTTVESINFDALKKFKIKITAIEEQKEIVRILDSLLAKEQQTKELAEQILQKIDLMKKSILARAFRGELN